MFVHGGVYLDGGKAIVPADTEEEDEEEEEAEEEEGPRQAPPPHTCHSLSISSQGLHR